MTYIVLMCDVLGLIAMCILATTASVVFSLWRLLMAGFLRSAMMLSDRGLGMFSRMSVPNLKWITRGSKTWIVISIGRFSVGCALEKIPGKGFEVVSDVSGYKDDTDAR